MYVYIYIYICTHMHTYAYTHLILYMHTYSRLPGLESSKIIYIYLYIHIYIYIYIYICIHMHIHIYCIYTYSRLPGLESSKINTSGEDELYNEMMTSLLRIVTKPLSATTLPSVAPLEPPSAVSLPLTPVASYALNTPSAVSLPPIPTLIKDGVKVKHGLWMLVKDVYPSMDYSPNKLWQNTFNWKAFTFKNKGKIVIS
jgi:hypothetical protein